MAPSEFRLLNGAGPLRVGFRPEDSANVDLMLQTLSGMSLLAVSPLLSAFGGRVSRLLLPGLPSCLLSRLPPPALCFPAPLWSLPGRR